MMTNPVSTSCGHQFCRFCLTEFLGRKRQVPCPLCKKPITKRGLMDREQLDGVVKGVRDLITAFQVDTGAIFSPVRGPEEIPMIGTPDDIATKPKHKPVVSGKKTNVRRAPTRQAGRIARNSVSLLSEPNDTSGEPQTSHEQQLIQLIEGGLNHNRRQDKNHRNCAVPDNLSPSSKTSNPPLDKDDELLNLLDDDPDVENDLDLIPDEEINEINETDNVEVEATDHTKTDPEITRKCSKQNKLASGKCRKVADESAEHNTDQVEYQTDSMNENELSDKNITNIDDMSEENEIHEHDIEVENIVSNSNKNDNNNGTPTNTPEALSGSSAATSENSSGPLFKIPLERPRKTKPTLDLVEINRKTRSRRKQCDGIEESDDISTLTPVQTETQDPVVEFNTKTEAHAKVTYSRRHATKALPGKVLKAKEKVSDWLEHKSDREKQVDKVQVDKEQKHQEESHVGKRLTKREMKIKEEELKMGQKMKHLAEQVSILDENFGFDFDDENGDVVSEEKAVTDKSDTKLEQKQLVDDDNGNVAEIDAEVIPDVNENSENDDSIKLKGVEAGFDKSLDTEKPVEEIEEVEKPIIPVKRKRIFKTRGTKGENSASSNSADTTQSNSENGPEVSNPMENKNPIYANAVDENSPLNQSDPFEFKSSQPTPKKPLKGKKKRNRKGAAQKGNKAKTANTVKNLANEMNKNKDAKNKPVVSDSINSNNPAWNKDSVPQKAILKGKNCKSEIDKINEKLRQAEDFDLTTCTQEAVERIEKANNKKVRFTEPTISDFIEPGRIDINGYRQAKSKFANESEVENVKGTNNEKAITPTRDSSKEGKKTGRTSEMVKTDENVQDLTEVDRESDDLSEDYRFEEDSSGTDDLDINPTAEQFEEPDIAIQSDEVKDSILAKQQNDAKESRIVTKSNTVDIIEETPLIHLGPKFNKTKIAKKTADGGLNEKGCLVKNSDSEAIDNINSSEVKRGNTRTFEPVKGKTKATKSKGMEKGNETAKTNKFLEKYEVEIVAETPLLLNAAENKNLDSDPNTNDMDNEVHIGENPLEDDNDMIMEREVKDEDVENCKVDGMLEEREEAKLENNDFRKEHVGADIIDSDQTQSTQTNSVGEVFVTSDNLDHCKSVSRQNSQVSQQMIVSQSPIEAESEGTQDSVSILKTSKSSSKKTSAKERDSEVIEVEEKPKVDNKSHVKLGGNKKKRKCFMLEEEESLDFGSYVEELEAQGKAKILKCDKNKRDDPEEERIVSDNNEKETTSTDKLIESIRELLDSPVKITPSPSLEIIEDTDKLHQDKESMEVDPSLQKDTETSVSRSQSMESSIKPDVVVDDEETLDPENIVDIECESKNMEQQENEKSNSKQMRSDSQSSKRKPKSRKRRQSSRDSHDLSGLLRSPNESFTGGQSVEDIFTGESELPTVDASPLDSPHECPTLSQNSCIEMAKEKSDEEEIEEIAETIEEKDMETNEQDLENDEIPNDFVTSSNKSDIQKSKTNDLEADKLDFDNEVKQKDTDNDKHTGSTVNSSESSVKRTKTLRGFARKNSPYGKSESPIETASFKSSLAENSGTFTPLKSQPSPVNYESPKVTDSNAAMVVDLVSEQLTPSRKTVNKSAHLTPNMNSPLINKHLDSYSTSTPVRSSGASVTKYTPKLTKYSPNPLKYSPNVSKYSPALRRARVNTTSTPLKVQQQITAEVVEMDPSNDSEVSDIEKSQKSNKTDLDSDSALPDTLENLRTTISRSNKRKGIPERSDTKEVKDNTANEVEEDSDMMDPPNDLRENENGMSSQKNPSESTLAIAETELDIDDSVNCAVGGIEEANEVESIKDGENDNSSDSSDYFQLDDNDDGEEKEDSPKMIALKAISDLNAIKEMFEGKASRKDDKSNDKMKNGKTVKSYDYDLLSTNLDSSPEESKNGSAIGSQQVILESDIEDETVDPNEVIEVDSDNVNGNKRSRKKRVNIIESDSDDDDDKSIVLLDDKTENVNGVEKNVDNMEYDMNESDDEIDDISKTRTLKRSNRVDSDDDEQDVNDRKKRKGTGRAIESDDDSDDEESLPEVNMTSSSVYSSQSENLNSQERLALEKDLERLAEERAAIEQQLKQHKHKHNQESVPDLEDVEIVNSVSDDEVAMEMYDNDIDHDFHLTPPPENTESSSSPPPLPIAPGVDMESKDIKQEVLTIPDSNPSQPDRPALADIDTNIPRRDNSVGNKRNICIVVTGLSTSQTQMTKKLAALNDAKFFSRFNDAVTHVVVKPVDEDDRLCERTLKFFQGIASKCWVVNYNWVVDSKQAGYLLPETGYEIEGDTAYGDRHRGPRRSRLSKHKLFSNLQFYLIGDNEYLSKDSLTDLITLCGGKTCCDLEKLGQRERSRSLVISCTDMEEENDEDGQREITRTAQDIYQDHGVVTVAREWVLDSLTLFKVVPVKDYILPELSDGNCPSLG